MNEKWKLGGLVDQHPDFDAREIVVEDGAARPRVIALVAAGEFEPRGEGRARLMAAAPGLYAYAACRRAFDEYNRPGSGFTATQLLEVIQRRGWKETDTIACYAWVCKIGDDALARAEGRDA